MDAVMTLQDVKLEDLEIEYEAFRPDPDVGEGWTFNIKKVSYLILHPNHPPYDIGYWLALYYNDEIMSFLTEQHEQGLA